jgi:hypothetical protein
MIIGSSWDWSENSPYISSYHKNYAVTFQAVVDADGRFSHVCAGSPSSLSNKQILEVSGLKKEFLQKFVSNENGQGTGEESADQGQQHLPARIVADESYGSNDPSSAEENEEAGPSSNKEDHPECLMTPEEVETEFQDENEQQLLLEKIAQGRDLFDDAVFSVKCRWKIFHGKNGKINFSADAFEKIALASCILHNICELKDDKIDPSWGSDIGPEVYNRQGYPKESSTADDDVEDEEEFEEDIAGDGDQGGEMLEDMEMEIAVMGDESAGLDMSALGAASENEDGVVDEGVAIPQ